MTQTELSKLAMRFKWERVDEQEVPTGKPRAIYDVMRFSCGIYEKLMSALAEHVKNYRADIVYDLYNVLDMCRQIDEQGIVPQREYLLNIFGLRESGVDSLTFIRERTEGGSMGAYSAIYLLTIKKTEYGYVAVLYKATSLIKTA